MGYPVPFPHRLINCIACVGSCATTPGDRFKHSHRLDITRGLEYSTSKYIHVGTKNGYLL
jgi:hypothetical protein